MEWRDQGILLGVRRHGEGSAILDLFTETRGRHLGIVRGGGSRKMAPLLQPGAQLDATWRARLEAHLGSYTVDLVHGRAAEAMEDRLALAGLNAVCALLSFALPEREAHPALYARSVALLDGLGAERWAQAYLTWELALLEDVGFGLDLSRCAVTGTTADLAFVSPKTGRAVSRGAAGDWAPRLLPLPNGLRRGTRPESIADLSAGLKVTGFFLSDHLAPSLRDRPVPAARQRFVDLVSRQSLDQPSSG